MVISYALAKGFHNEFRRFNDVQPPSSVSLCSEVVVASLAKIHDYGQLTNVVKPHKTGSSTLLSWQCGGMLYVYSMSCCAHTVYVK